MENMSNVDIILAIENDSLTIRNPKEWDRVIQLVFDLKDSQGFYGRLLNDLLQFVESYGGSEFIPYPIVI